VHTRERAKTPVAARGATGVWGEILRVGGHVRAKKCKKHRERGKLGFELPAETL